MTVSTSASLLLSTTLAVLLFAGMQIYKQQLASNEKMTLVGGILGSGLFVLVLTAISNFEMTTFGPHFQSKIFPEVAMAMLVAIFASGMIHRVCATSCLIMSVVALYYINRISAAKYAAPVPTTSAHPVQGKQKKRN